MSPKVIAEYSSQGWTPSTRLAKTLHTKAYLVFLDQPWRRFVLGMSIAKQQMRMHFYDHSGCSISPPFDVHSDPAAFVAVLAAVMFGSRLSYPYFSQLQLQSNLGPPDLSLGIDATPDLVRPSPAP